jgi:hypothetical protein
MALLVIAIQRAAGSTPAPFIYSRF